ncbi:biotin-dependent carboxyltransferase family protein [Aliiroseovarius crassostreae]|uniref:5-oxoprolinase subunit C family protein n=1 Tax=Aliiroseovarius crassostreae TaxID=154981 RepID=UPI003C7DCB0A
MADAHLRVGFAGPLISFQDAGRPGHMRFGVPRSGPMDRLSHRAANTALGQPADSTTIEVSLAGMSIDCLDGAVTLSIAGGAFRIDHAGQVDTGWRVVTLRAGERLTMRPGPRGSWAYLAVAGHFLTQTWLGHSATHSISGFGGGAIRSGQEITVIDAEIREDREGPIPEPDFHVPDKTTDVVMGPQDQHFSRLAIERFLTENFALSDAFDRMGVRLTGAKLDLERALSIPSEPVLRGAIQVAGDGVPTILLADHQTTGGYPKIATIPSYDLDRVAQMRAHDAISFVPITADQAVAASRKYAHLCRHYLNQIAIPRGNLTQRLMRDNLISGVVAWPDME